MSTRSPLKKFGIWGNTDKEKFWDLLEPILDWSKKNSLGMDDEIRVVCSEIDEPLLREYLSDIFDDTLYTLRLCTLNNLNNCQDIEYQLEVLTDGDVNGDGQTNIFDIIVLYF